MELVWRVFPGKGSELLTMLAMANWCNDQGGDLFPAVATVSKRIRASESQARRLIHKLIADEWISVIGNSSGGAPGTTRRYVLNVAKLTEAARSHATPSDDATPRTHALDGSHGCEKTGSTDASQHVKKQPLAPVKKRVVARDMQQPIGVDELVLEGADRQHAEDWLKARRAKRAPLTVTAWTDVKAEAAKAGISCAEAVRIAAVRSWQGFNASWLKSPASGPKPTIHSGGQHGSFDDRAYGEGGVL